MKLTKGKPTDFSLTLASIFEMRKVLAIILFIVVGTAYGQDKHLLGKYTQSFFMYEFYLTLKDSGQFVIDEYTDMGSRTTEGTWTYLKDTVRLTPKKVYRWDGRFPNQEKKDLAIVINEIVIAVDNHQRLKIISPQKTDMTYRDKELDRIE